MKRIVGFLVAFMVVVVLGGCGSAKGETTKMSNTINKQNKILVAYFSASGNTEKVAQNIATIIGADIYKIEPQEPYSSADLNYSNSNSRSSKERDSKVRPAINGKVNNMGQYDVVLLGYPIWWGEAPKIVDTFLESYDFSGKTIVPFCTSGSSSIGASASKLATKISKATWKEGGRLTLGDSKEKLSDWLKGQGVKTK